MGIREIFRLDPSTVEAGRRCVNLLARALILGVTLALLLALNLGLSSLISLLTGPFGIDERTRQLLSQVVLVFVIVVSVAAVLMSVMDVLTLLWYQLPGREHRDDRKQNGQRDEEEGGPSSG